VARFREGEAVSNTEIDRLRAENERLRKALEDIASKATMQHAGSAFVNGMRVSFDVCASIARAALKEGGM
jgi:hypothetical protein